MRISARLLPRRFLQALLLTVFPNLAFACESFVGKWDLYYLGPLSGAAILELRPTVGGEAPVSLYLQQADDTPLRLDGRATCEHHKITMKLGGGSSSDGQFRILGGTMVGMLDSAPFPSPFGAWSFSVIRLSNFQELPMEGFWKILKPTVGVSSAGGD